MSQPASSERELLLRARKGDEGAARALWEALAPRLLSYASLLAGEVDADDIVQAVFVRVLRAPRRQIAGPDDLTAWMLRCVRNEALNTLRSGARRRAREAGAQAPEIGASVAQPPDPELNAALATLPPEQREAVWLYHAAALTFDQLALALDVPRSTAASRYRVGIRRLREALHGPPAGCSAPDGLADGRAIKEANHV